MQIRRSPIPRKRGLAGIPVAPADELTKGGIVLNLPMAGCHELLVPLHMQAWSGMLSNLGPVLFRAVLSSLRGDGTDGFCLRRCGVLPKGSAAFKDREFPACSRKKKQIYAVRFGGVPQGVFS